ncbi:disulfide bond formation protein B [Salibacterium salarium]|uniref:Disulfide bond formation protein B n=2 Tax=Salibacterium salarium TaxID=284579 RepID=A0A3R9QF46_9BACI|nr:disulfide bond formation protein B [Salibacterium salarium]RSL29006.1 disulfide bond formation protein B [Salibacterium salarium]
MFILILIISLLATSGSLYLSEVVGFKPCELCWYQRLFMYPIPLIILISLAIEDYKSRYFIAFFSLIGSIIAAYHYIIQISQTGGTFCDIGDDCIIMYFQSLGFITIPFLSLIAFILIFIVSILTIYSKKLK